MRSGKLAMFVTMVGSLGLLGGCTIADVWWHWVLLGAGLFGVSQLGGVTLPL